MTVLTFNEQNRLGGTVVASAAPLGLLAATHFLMTADRNLPALVLPILKQQFALSDTALGFLQGPAFVLFFVVATLAFGRVVDRAPHLKLLAISIVLWTLASIGFGLATSWQQLVVCRLMLGLFQAAVAPAALSVIVARTPVERVGRAISVFTTGSAVGRGGAMLLGGALLAWIASPLMRGAFPGFETWRVLFFLSTLPNLLVAVALLLTDRRGRATAAAPRPPSLLPALEWLRAWPLAFAAHLIAAGSVIVLVQAVSAWMPTLLQRELGLSPARSGIVSGLIVVLGAPLGHRLGGALVDLCRRTGRSPSLVVVVTLAFSVVGAALLCLAPSMITMSLGLFMLTVFGGAAAVAFLAMFQRMSPDARGVSNAIFFAITTLMGLGLGPPVIGLLSDRVFGPGELGKALLSTTAVAAVVAAGLAWGSRKAWARVVRAAETHGADA
ncbi:sugar phosphate permease [Caulobacter sp. AP07]|uniref:MFS transporter n=1 Tax=Caulobacter sp. AP07 TaxID=1144304 RepID=UPI000271D9AC|nr:MFS transporter [Caulobacter sp. AP07]EJL36296.1 sugar phosphate permease [Caulobacter sp. AP07]